MDWHELLDHRIVTGIIAAVVGFLSAWLSARVAYRKAAVDHDATEAQARQALRDDMMQYVEELRKEIVELRGDNGRLRQENARIPLLEAEVSKLKARVAELESCR